MEPTPLTGSQTVHPNNAVATGFPQPEYSQAMKDYIVYKRARLISARDVRDAPHAEFDDMPFLKYYDILKKADDQYVAPRKNKVDTSINTGTIRDKDTTLVEYAMKYDFEPVAQCFDDNDEMMQEIAETGEDLVRKSLMLENDIEKQKLVARSMVAFGTALVEDMWLERWTTEKEFAKGVKIGSSTPDWTDKKVKSYEGCQQKLWDLRKCYFGDLRKFFMNGPQGQPYFFTVEYESYDVVKTFFGDWDMWQFVPNTVVMTPEVGSAVIYGSWWTLRPVSLNYCEIVRYYDPIANEYSITINGIEMLPIKETKKTINGIEKTLISGFPLSAVSPAGAIPMAKYDLEPMHDFAYSKSQPGKMRVLADVENMWYKLMLGMMKQKAKPTMGNKSGRNFTNEEATTPSEIINDIREGDLFPILPNYKGADQSDYSFYELTKKELDKNSVERSFQGINNGPNDKTATQDMNEMKAASLKIASTLDGLISGRKQLFWLRTYSIITHWTKPVSSEIDVFKKAIVDKYRTVSVPVQVDGGKKAVKKIMFTKDTAGKTPQDVHQMEMDAYKNGEGEVRVVLLHPELLKSMKLSWYYNCVPVPNGSDPLSYMMFAKQITDATAFFGQDSMNVKKLKHQFAIKTGVDFDTWFISEQELEQKQQQAQQEAQAQASMGKMTGSSASGPGNSTKSQLAQHGAPTIGQAIGNKMPQVMQ